MESGFNLSSFVVERPFASFPDQRYWWLGSNQYTIVPGTRTDLYHALELEMGAPSANAVMSLVSFEKS